MEQLVVQILRTAAVLRATALSRTTLWRRVRDGSFPAPIRLAGRGRVRSGGYVPTLKTGFTRALKRKAALYRLAATVDRDAE